MALRLHQLPPSPNNLRVRLALAVKGLDYENCVVPFTSDRSEIVELVLGLHQDRVALVDQRGERAGADQPGGDHVGLAGA